MAFPLSFAPEGFEPDERHSAAPPRTAAAPSRIVSCFVVILKLLSVFADCRRQPSIAVDRNRLIFTLRALPAQISAQKPEQHHQHRHERDVDDLQAKAQRVYVGRKLLADVFELLAGLGLALAELDDLVLLLLREDEALAALLLLLERGEALLRLLEVTLIFSKIR